MNKALSMHVLCNFFIFQDYKFQNPFYEPPSVLASARHENVTSALWMKADGRFGNALNVWIEVSNFLDHAYTAMYLSLFIETDGRVLFSIASTLRVSD